MKHGVGEIAMLLIDGKVAEKDESGKLTGRMIAFKKGDVGAVIEERGKSWKDKVYMISLAKGVVTLRANALSFPDSDDVRIPQAALKKADPDYSIRDEDRDEGADY
jgi:hypothetical protein